MAASEPASVTTLVTYLEMRAPPPGRLRPPPGRGLEVRRACRPTISFYRYLYENVGRDWTWTERRILGDPELAAIIHHPDDEVNVLFAEGVPAGYAELDRRAPPDVELAYFGLMPEFTRQGLGTFLLDWAIRHAWRAAPRRLWVHTCDLDDPRALDLYQSAGFRIYDRRTERVTLPAGMRAPRAEDERYHPHRTVAGPPSPSPRAARASAIRSAMISLPFGDTWAKST